MHIKKRSITGILILTAFISILWYSASYFNPSMPTPSARFKQIQKDIAEFFKKPETRRIITRSVVEEESSVIDVVENVSPSVVSVLIKTFVFDPFSGPLSSEEGIGTGFIVEPTGIVVTNAHVVDNPAGEYSVVLSNGQTYDVEKIHLDSVTDIAILEISARDLPVVELGDSSVLRVGQRAIAIGNALGRYSNTVTAGVISGIARQLTASGAFGEMKTYEEAIQTDAALNPGNSGGPLLNSLGQVIGINVATTRGADNIGFAIPVNTLKPILGVFLERGKIVKPYLGVSYTMITKEIAALRGFPEGAFISHIILGTAAADAGIQRGDIIVEMDGEKIDSENPLSVVIARHKVGDIVEIVVDREGDEMSLTAKLGEFSED